jgi:tetratricopeptide (TPR) repeat protein
MAASGPIRSEQPTRLMVFGVLALVLALRILQLSSAAQSPLTYQPGPDEDYYWRFGQAVAAGHGADSPEFTFMDPLYGYLLGAVIKVAGVNPFAVYLLQVLLDTATAFGVLVIGRLLGQARAGLYGALLYGLTSTAILFTTTLLKETCVASFITWWVAGALALLRRERGLAWFAFGVYCGIGVALRSTLLALAAMALLLPFVEAGQGAPGRRWRSWGRSAGPLALGLLLAMLPWSLRNWQAGDGLSPLPHNGGVVLHQIYNADNPGATIWIPPFVNYSHPSEIWRGYAAEAERRAGHALSASQVDRYWRDQALAYLAQQPGVVLRGWVRKALAFWSATEIPNNRSAAEERLFSPVLAALPAPATWLLALGLTGLAWFVLADRRWPVLAAPVAIALLTMAAFWAEDRFRSHVLPILALGSGLFIAGVLGHAREMPPRRLAAFAALAVCIAVGSLVLGRLNPAPAVRWDHVVWGYIKMGRIPEARQLAQRIATEQPDNGPIVEALAYTASAGGQYGEAAAELERAIALRPRSHVAHYNLARAYLALGRREDAAREAQTALGLHPSPDYQDLVRQAEAPP